MITELYYHGNESENIELMEHISEQKNKLKCVNKSPRRIKCDSICLLFGDDINIQNIMCVRKMIS